MATLPEARLGGALLWMVVAAVLLCALGLAGWVFAFDRLREIGLRYMIAVSFIIVWSAAFVVMTLLRVRATPLLVSIGFVAWVVFRFCVTYFGQGGFLERLMLQWPLAIDYLGELIMAAAFCGYMAMADRPNAYYRRRLLAR